jgi:hypothetical protein
VSIRRQLAFVAALCAALVVAPSSLADTVFALAHPATGGDTLSQFQTTTPGTVSSPIAITGLVAGDTLLAIDFRPANGQLYGVSSSGRMYTINTATGVATQVGPGPSFAPTGSLGMDVNPAVDLIRVVSDTDFNQRLDPATGAAVSPDNNLAYDAADTNAGTNPSVVALGYTNNVAGAGSTTLYGIDSGLDILVRLGSPGGTPFSGNTGLLFTIGSLALGPGVDVTNAAGLDISPSGTAYALLHTAQNSIGAFYTINLSTGAATLVGAIAGQAPYADIAVQTPTAVRMQSLAAVRTKRGVSVRWRTATSTDILGFNVYREKRGQRVRLNRNLISSGGLVAGKSYSFLDRHPLRVSARYWVQLVATDGTRTWYGPAAARGAG